MRSSQRLKNSIVGRFTRGLLRRMAAHQSVRLHSCQRRRVVVALRATRRAGLRTHRPCRLAALAGQQQVVDQHRAVDRRVEAPRVVDESRKLPGALLRLSMSHT